MGSPQQAYATGTYSDGSTADITNAVTWTVSDTSIATVGTFTGLVTIADAGKIWGGTIGLTATLAPGTPGTASIVVVSCDSGSVAPRMPQSDDQWMALGLSPWGSWWGLQELTGNLVGSGSAAFTLAASVAPAGGVISFGQTESGWLRKTIVLSGTNSGGSPNFRGTGPNLQTSSTAFLAYCRMPLGQGNLGLFGQPSDSATNILAMASHTSFGYYGEVMARIQGTSKMVICPTPARMDDRIHPMLVVYNKTTGDALACTDMGVVVSSSLAAFSATSVGLGPLFGTTGGAASASFSYFAIATGSIVEPLTDPSGAADFLSRLGWNVIWKDCPIDSGSIRLPYVPHHWKQLGQQPWTATWNMQEPAGTSLVSYNGWDGKNVAAWTLTPSNAALRYPCPGWMRVGVNLTNATSRRIMITDVLNGDDNLWNPTGSIAMMVYGDIEAVGGGSYGLIGSSPSVSQLGAGGTVALHGVGLGKKLAVYCSGTSVTGSYDHADGRVHPFMLVYDATNQRVKGYSDLEAITGSYQPLSLYTSLTSSIGIGGIPQWVTSVAVSGTYLYFTICTGSLAEQLSDDGQASQFLKSLGWNPPW
jgi:hypothetical protein